MAEIHVERRRRSVWPWIVGLAIVGLVLWAVAGATDDNAERYTSGGDVTVAPAVAPVPVAPGILFIETRRYIDFTKQPPDFGDVNRAHEYTRTGLGYLASALEEVAGGSAAPRAKIAALRLSAEELGEKNDVTHAHIVSVTLKQAADAIAEVQQDKYPALSSEVDRVRKAADAVKPDRQLLEQADEVKAFFAAAADILQRMGAAPPATMDSGHGL